jgi:hypothetical protein
LEVVPLGTMNFPGRGLRTPYTAVYERVLSFYDRILAYYMIQFTIVFLRDRIRRNMLKNGNRKLPFFSPYTVVYDRACLIWVNTQILLIIKW